MVCQRDIARKIRDKDPYYVSAVRTLMRLMRLMRSMPTFHLPSTSQVLNGEVQAIV